MRNFDEALRTLNGRDSRKIDNNTRLERINADEIGVKLHATYVVRYKRNGSITIHSGGWQTVTTKDRINNYSPARISQRAGVWYMGDGEPFEEGAEVGMVSAQPVSLFN